MLSKGFVVRDCKPQHVIVRPDARGVVRGATRNPLRLGGLRAAERTPGREQEVRAVKRKAYLVRQARRFEAREAFPPHLAPVRIFGVDYVYGTSRAPRGLVGGRKGPRALRLLPAGKVAKDARTSCR